MRLISLLAMLLLAGVAAAAQQTVNCATATPCVNNGPTKTTTGDQLPAAGTKINANFAELYGLVAPVPCSGDATGATDTPVLQAAINAMPTKAGFIQLSSCTYYINASLTIPFKSGFHIFGRSRGGTIIQQVTDSTPIWVFTGNLTNGWDMGFMTLQWTNNQSTSQTGAIGFYFNTGTATDNIFNFHITSIVCSNGFRCFSINSALPDNVWGFTIDNSVQGGLMQGAFFNNSGSPAGEPNLRFRDIYLGTFSTTVPVAEPEFVIHSGDQVLLEGIEINGGLYGPGLPQIDVTTSTGVTLIGVKSELETITGSSGTGTALWSFVNDTVVLNNVKLLSATVNSGNATFIFGSPSTYGFLSINGEVCNAFQGTGSGNHVYAYYNGVPTNAAENFTSAQGVNTSASGGICTTSLIANLGNVAEPKANLDSMKLYPIISGGTAITIAPGSNACGTAGSIHGGAWGFDFTVGTGGAACDWIVTIGGSVPTTAPVQWNCRGSDETDGIPVVQTGHGTTTATISTKATTATGARISGDCFGH